MLGRLAKVSGGVFGRCANLLTDIIMFSLLGFIQDFSQVYSATLHLHSPTPRRLLDVAQACKLNACLVQ